MGYTLSFDASVKCKAGDVKGWLHHIARDVDQQQDKEVRHSNPDIDPTRTKYNQTAVYNQQTGEFEQCEDISQVEQSIADRLATVTKPLRKDAVVVRPLVLQLDPKWYAVHQSQDEREKVASDMMDWAVKTFGAKNLVTMSLNNDETNPHLHIGFTPVTEDGRLSQKDWFTSPKKLQEMHQSFREHMRDRGYDIEMDNKKPGKHAKRLPDKEYKDFAELKKQKEAMEIREATVKAQEQDIQQRLQYIRARETAVDEMEAKAQTKEQEAQKQLQTASETLREAQTLLDDIKDQQTREALQSRLQAIQRPLPSNAPTVTQQTPDRQYQ